jgi:hypothetical protein
VARALRIAGATALVMLLAAAVAWWSFPWYARHLVDRTTSGTGLRLVMHDMQRPSLRGIAIGRIEAFVRTAPDSCTGIASTYRLSLHGARLTLRTDASRGILTARLRMEADSLSARMHPAEIIFRDGNPSLTARLDLFRKPAGGFGYSADSLAYAVEGASIETGTLKLDGVNYRVLFERSKKWVQQAARFRARSLASGGNKTPLTEIEAWVGMARSPEKPCSIRFSDCSARLFGLRASTPLIEYSLRERRSSFTLNIDPVPVDRLAGIAGYRAPNPSLSGTLSGSIPVVYGDATIEIRNGIVDAAPGTLLVWKDPGGNAMVSIDTGRRSGGVPAIADLHAVVALQAGEGKAGQIAIGKLQAKLFGGTISARPFSYDAETGNASCTLLLDRVPVLERIRLHGGLSSAMGGTVSGRLPIAISRKGIAIRHASLSSPGAGTVRQRPAPSAPGDATSFTGAGREALWNFRHPVLLVDRKESGSLAIGFSLDSLSRKQDGGALLLSTPKGTVTMGTPGKRPAVITLSDFSTGLFDGTLSIDRVDYDLGSKRAATTLRFSGIPLQQLLDLQGTGRILATGTLRGRIPVVIEGDAFRIPDGGMDAEESGRIVYASTPEERASAGTGMRFTYEALGNFLYSELASSISMEPDGQSVITVSIRGHNPDFQEGRPVQLNLNIRQNLHDLFRSLSIASGIEREITEKALRKK